MAKISALGATKVTTAGTPVPLIASGADATLVSAGIRSYQIQSLPTNTGKMYLLSNSSAADTTNYSNVLYVWTSAGESLGNAALAMNSIDRITDLYLDSQINGEGVLITVTIE